MLSIRSKMLSQSIFSKYDDRIHARMKNGIKYYKLNTGQPKFDTDKLYFEELSNLKLKVNAYSNPSGIDNLKEAVCKYYRNYKNISLNNVVITQGASDAIIKLLYSVCDVGDEVLIAEPFFTDYILYCKLLNIKAKFIKYSDMNYDNLKNKITAKTKAILFSNPNNPDGSIITIDNVKSLLAIAKEKNLLIISDEVYSGLVYTNDYISFANYLSKNVVVVDSASKKLNLCGSRIGYIILKNESLRNRIVIMNDYRISISNAEQYAVAKMLNNADTLIKKYTYEYQKRINIVKETLKKTSIKYIIPNGGMTMILIFPFKNTNKYAQWLINEYSNNNKSLLLVSGNYFYSTLHGNNKARICLTLSEEELKEALNLLIDSCNKYMEVIKC